MGDLFSFKDVTFGYGGESLFTDLNFTMKEGEFVGLIGGNGVGKSTFCNLLLGRLRPQSGKILFRNQPVSQMDKDGSIGYVPQLGSGSRLNFPITVREMVSLSLYPELSGLKRLNREQKEKTDFAIATVGLRGKEDSLFGQLSGGQRQRALLAKAIVNNPEFLLFDEPTTGIDEETRGEIYRMLDHFHKCHGISIFMITHEPDEVKNYMNRVMKLESGKIRQVVP